MLTVDEARARILSKVAVVPTEEAPVSQCLGRTLAAELPALRDQPPSDVSSMDGYALNAAGLEKHGRLTVVGVSQAGTGYPSSISETQAVRIFTGAPVPEGADTILIQENAEVANDILRATSPATAGQYVRARGLDFSAGETFFGKGHRLASRDLALAAGLGHGSLTVRKRPRVAILSTGDELVAPGETPARDQIIATGALAVAGLVETAGGEPVDLGIARDTTEALTAAIRQIRSLQPAAVVVLGGASVGDHDLVRQVFTAGGMTLDFWKIAMRPGKPMMFGELDGVPVLGLPGNAVSAQVCGLLFMQPLVRALLGRKAVFSDVHQGLLGVDLPANGTREDYMRAKIHKDAQGKIWLHPFEVQDSSMTATMALADALLVRDTGAPEARRGEVCRFLSLDNGC